jgi:hypothetical protein
MPISLLIIGRNYIATIPLDSNPKEAINLYCLMESLFGLLIAF